MNWKRPFHIAQIVAHLQQFDEVGEIIVWDNSNELPDIDGCRVIRSPGNECTLGRFRAAQQARHDVCFTQDDDLIVHNIERLLAAFQSRETAISEIFLDQCPLFAPAGDIQAELFVDSFPIFPPSGNIKAKRIVANLADDASSKHFYWWQVHRPPWCELGFGSVFPREWAFSLDSWPYDEELRRRKADKIFSVIHPWRAMRAGPDDLTRLTFGGKESGRDEHALSNRGDHKFFTEEAVRLAQQWAAQRKTA